MRLTGRALTGLQSAADGRIVWSSLHPEDFSATGGGAGDTEGIVDTLKQAEGQQACFLLKSPEGGDHWQVSLRSPVADVAEVARAYGGGGHARAAGFDYHGSLDDLVPALVEALSRQLGHRGGGVDGFLNLLKPPGMTSHDVVAYVRRWCDSAGWAIQGTLDPAAAGVLIVAVGVATRLGEYFWSATNRTGPSSPWASVPRRPMPRARSWSAIRHRP